MVRFGKLLSGAAFVASIFGAQQASALSFNLIDYNGSVAGTAAEKGFKIATDYWASILTNDVTVNLEIGYNPLASGVIGSTSSHKLGVYTSDVYDQLAATGNSALDAIAVSHLKPLDANGNLDFITNSNAGNKVSKTNKVYDNNDSANNYALAVNSSVLKALDYTGITGADGRVNFSTNFSFDFDPTDGIQAGKMDFIGVAIHEIGHALGFTSGVDTYDAYAQGTTSPNSGATINLNNYAIFSTLDLFRYSADTANIDPSVVGPALDLSTGGTTYFSINGGSVYNNNAYFSTGAYAGDGRQASHFKDAAGCTGQIGIMDPTFCYSQMGEVTGVDVAAFDAMGWNVSFDALAHPGYHRTTAQIYQQFGDVPEPASWAMMLAGFGLVGGTLRRRSVRFANAG